MTHNCSSCIDGENYVEADWHVALQAKPQKLTIGYSSEKEEPIIGYLCEEHYNMYLDDGYKTVYAKPISDRVKDEKEIKA